MISKRVFLSVTVAALVFIGCGDEKETVEQKPAAKQQEAEKTQPTAVQKAAATTGSYVEAAAKKVEEIAKDVQKNAAPTAEKIANKVEKVQTVVVESVKDSVQTVKEKTAPMVKTVKEAVVGPDAVTLYTKCAGCHGVRAEKKALGKSQIIKGWDTAKIADSLKGYKAGTYGGAMKAVMKGQVDSMSDAQIDALSAHIASF